MDKPKAGDTPTKTDHAIGTEQKHLELPDGGNGATKPSLRAYSLGPPPPAGARRLHLNEFRYQHPPEVQAALRGALQEMSVEDLLTRYLSGPDPALIEDLAKYVGAPGPENILVAAGSDEVLRAVLDTSEMRGHKTLLMGVPGYTHFEHYARLKGLEIVAYPIGLSTPACEHAASLFYYSDLLARGCLVYLCSPNNPTGDLWESAVVELLATKYPRSMFLIDEAYIEFASCADGNTAFAPTADHAAAMNTKSLTKSALAFSNVVTTRTMSKAFGFAALRIGYAVGTAETIKTLGIAVSPKAFSPIASPVARAALRCLAHYRMTTASAKRETKLVVSTLNGLGWWVLDTPGNFYLVYAGNASDLTEKLAKRGIQVRNRDDLPGLAGFIRLTAGDSADSLAVIGAFSALTPPKAPPPQTLYTSKGKIAAVKTLMKQTLSVLAAAGVETWAQGGTMLGIFRHRSALIPGGMPPWDDDGDLAYFIPASGVDPLAALVDRFKAEGLTLQRNRTDAYWQVGTNLCGSVISPIHIDVFSYRAETQPGAEGKTAYVLDDIRFREEAPNSPGAHCNTRYSHDELFPLSTEYRFYDLTIRMPAKSGAVLQRALGPNFMTEARVRTGPESSTSFVLQDLTPA